MNLLGVLCFSSVWLLLSSAVPSLWLVVRLYCCIREVDVWSQLCRPSAAASGLPELIGFLNGTVVRHIFNIKTLVAKFFSCLAAVASGLPVGPEGPMIHMGYVNWKGLDYVWACNACYELHMYSSLIGAGLSQMRSKTLGFHLPVFGRFRNSEDR